eukprot:13620036-Heterocapsa_arctica.AAC.1
MCIRDSDVHRGICPDCGVGDGVESFRGAADQGVDDTFGAHEHRRSVHGPFLAYHGHEDRWPFDAPNEREAEEVAG